MITSCACGNHGFKFHMFGKTATCLQCGLIWELDENGDLCAPMLPSVTEEPIVPNKKPISVIDEMIAEMHR